ncbi:MAG: CpsD/CapB family tyrosine-protein kinase, partial [Desulfobacterales bacterium]|nr:CpsD/CapB family tyrosine-protein kinase [Desulfobacterales bacterium]
DSLIIDACPMFPTNRRMIDPVAFSGIVDGVVLVTMAHVTHRQKVMRAKSILETSGMNVLGVVFNKRNAPIG